MKKTMLPKNPVKKSKKKLFGVANKMSPKQAAMRDVKKAAVY